MSRTKAREIALHLIFEMGFQQFEDENLNERLDESIMASISGDIALYAGKLSEQQTEYIRSVVKGVAGHLDELDQTIETHAKGWKLSRLSRMTTAVLRLAIYEMRYVDDVPVGALRSTRRWSWPRCTMRKRLHPSSTACWARSRARSSRRLRLPRKDEPKVEEGNA